MLICGYTSTMVRSMTCMHLLHALIELLLVWRGRGVHTTERPLIKCFIAWLINFVFFVQIGKQSSTLKPVILREVMESQRQQIRDLISREKLHPQNYVNFFDKYASLISQQV